MRHNHFLPAIVILSSVIFGTAAGADHRGALGVLSNQTTNINDVYAFVDPNDPTMVVLAMSVNGFSVPGVNPIFGSDCLYQFKIDNTGDFVEDLVIQIAFEKPTGSPFAPAQNFRMIGPVKPSKIGGINSLAKLAKGATPMTGPIVNIPVTSNPATSGVPVNTFTADASTGIKVFCGLRDDAFTLDEIFLFNIIRGTLAAPSPPNTAPQRSTPGIDFFAGLNCSTIAIELPADMLTGTLRNAAGHKQLNIWATTSVASSIKRSLKAKKGAAPVGSETIAKTFVQLDRMAHPGINTFLIEDANKDAFNQGQPKDDEALFAAQAATRIEKLQLDKTTPAAIAAKADLLAIRFPDVLRLDVSSTAGFPVENGRRPQDDVISYELGLLTVGAVTNEGIPGSDGRVGGNDVPFLTVFPFFAPPHVPREGVPKRD